MDEGEKAKRNKKKGRGRSSSRLLPPLLLHWGPRESSRAAGSLETVPG